MKFFLTNFWTWDRLSSADAWQLPRRGRSGHEQLRRFRYSLSKNYWAEKKKKGGRERPTATTVTEHISYTQTRDRKTNKSNHKGGGEATPRHDSKSNKQQEKRAKKKEKKAKEKQEQHERKCEINNKPEGLKSSLQSWSKNDLYYKSQPAPPTLFSLLQCVYYTNKQPAVIEWLRLYI